MSKGNVTVLGSNGHIGHASMLAFRDAGWAVTGLGRSNRRPVGNTQFVAGNADDVSVVRKAIADADVVVHALHLPYDQWGNGRAEAQLQVVIDAMGNSGKTLLFPGTIYNYRAGDRTVSPGTRQRAEAPRGEIRIRLENMLRAAAAERKFQVIILRAGDFYGPGNRGEWFEQAMLMNLGKGKIHHMADLPLHGQMMTAIGRALDRSVAISPLPWWLLGTIGLVNPIMRDIYRMRYIWLNEMELVDPRLDALLGTDFTTPFEVAVATTVNELTQSRLAA
jgi:hypothetical protein